MVTAVRLLATETGQRASLDPVALLMQEQFISVRPTAKYPVRTAHEFQR